MSKARSRSRSPPGDASDGAARADAGEKDRDARQDAAALKRKRAAAKMAFLAGLNAAERERKERALKTLDEVMTALWHSKRYARRLRAVIAYETSWTALIALTHGLALFSHLEKDIVPREINNAPDTIPTSNFECFELWQSGKILLDDLRLIPVSKARSVNNSIPLPTTTSHPKTGGAGGSQSYTTEIVKTTSEMLQHLVQSVVLPARIGHWRQSMNGLHAIWHVTRQLLNRRAMNGPDFRRQNWWRAYWISATCLLDLLEGVKVRRADMEEEEQNDLIEKVYAAKTPDAERRAQSSGSAGPTMPFRSLEQLLSHQHVAGWMDNHNEIQTVQIDMAFCAHFLLFTLEAMYIARKWHRLLEVGTRFNKMFNKVYGGSLAPVFDHARNEIAKQQAEAAAAMTSLEEDGEAFSNVASKPPTPGFKVADVPRSPTLSDMLVTARGLRLTYYYLFTTRNWALDQTVVEAYYAASTAYDDLYHVACAREVTDIAGICAFEQGNLMYEYGDLDGALVAWSRSLDAVFKKKRVIAQGSFKAAADLSEGALKEAQLCHSTPYLLRFSAVRLLSGLRMLVQQRGRKSQSNGGWKWLGTDNDPEKDGLKRIFEHFKKVVELISVSGNEAVMSDVLPSARELVGDLEPIMQPCATTSNTPSTSHYSHSLSILEHVYMRYLLRSPRYCPVYIEAARVVTKHVIDLLRHGKVSAAYKAMKPVVDACMPHVTARIMVPQAVVWSWVNIGMSFGGGDHVDSLNTAKAMLLDTLKGLLDARGYDYAALSCVFCGLLSAASFSEWNKNLLLDRSEGDITLAVLAFHAARAAELRDLFEGGRTIGEPYDAFAVLMKGKFKAHDVPPTILRDVTDWFTGIADTVNGDDITKGNVSTVANANNPPPSTPPTWTVKLVLDYLRQLVQQSFSFAQPIWDGWEISVAGRIATINSYLVEQLGNKFVAVASVFNSSLMHPTLATLSSDAGAPQNLSEGLLRIPNDSACLLWTGAPVFVPSQPDCQKGLWKDRIYGTLVVIAPKDKDAKKKAATPPAPVPATSTPPAAAQPPATAQRRPSSPTKPASTALPASSSKESLAPSISAPAQDKSTDISLPSVLTHVFQTTPSSLTTLQTLLTQIVANLRRHTLTSDDVLLQSTSDLWLKAIKIVDGWFSPLSKDDTNSPTSQVTTLPMTLPVAERLLSMVGVDVDNALTTPYGSICTALAGKDTPDSTVFEYLSKVAVYSRSYAK
ncbi:hypothetical protein HDV00_009730 [Rhizophlyctis rosea]|nr:hypothetical protein HDV00_009730 [Rhizophlyctis rosea]